jgi:hypothetical protein
VIENGIFAEAVLAEFCYCYSPEPSAANATPLMYPTEQFGHDGRGNIGKTILLPEHIYAIPISREGPLSLEKFK